MSEIDSTLKDFLRTTRSMESNIVSIISDSNRDIEMILKELLIYLDATSKNLEKVQNSLIDFVKEYNQNEAANNITQRLDNVNSSLSATIKAYSDKLIELEVNSTKKILELVKQIGVTNQRILKQILLVATKITDEIDGYTGKLDSTSADLQEIKSLLKVITDEVRDTKSNVAYSQGNLMTVIDNIMDANTRKSMATEEVESQKIKSDEEKFKAKLKLISKIIGVVLGSGGIVYLLIDILLKAGG